MESALKDQGYNIKKVVSGMKDDAIRPIIESENAIFITQNYKDFKGLSRVIRVGKNVTIDKQTITTLNSLEAATINPEIWLRMKQIPASGLNLGLLNIPK